jgi:hypothetical protein
MPWNAVSEPDVCWVYLNHEVRLSLDWTHALAHFLMRKWESTFENLYGDGYDNGTEVRLYSSGRLQVFPWDPDSDFDDYDTTVNQFCKDYLIFTGKWQPGRLDPAMLDELYAANEQNRDDRIKRIMEALQCPEDIAKETLASAEEFKRNWRKDQGDTCGL